MAQHYPEFFYVSTKDNFYVCGLKLLSATVIRASNLKGFQSSSSVGLLKVSSLSLRPSI